MASRSIEIQWHRMRRDKQPDIVIRCDVEAAQWIADHLPMQDMATQELRSVIADIETEHGA